MKLHYFDGMKFHGDNACKYHGFERYDWKTDRELPALFWLYTEDDYKYLAAHQGKKYVFWNGSDVLRLANTYAQKVINIVRDPAIRHACQNTLLQSELAVMGIHAIVNPQFYGNEKKYKPEAPLTKDCYMTSNIGRGIEYGESIVNALAWQFPDWTFHIFGIDPVISTYCDNVRYYGQVTEDEMDEITKNFGICFRYNQHDGFSQTVMKALMRGHTAITTIDYGMLTRYCKSYSQICEVFGMWDFETLGNILTPNAFTNYNWCKDE